MTFSMQVFMQKVKQCNPTFKRFARTSDLDPVIDALGGEVGQKFYLPSHNPKINKATHALPTAAANKYRDALLYMAKELKADAGPVPCSQRMEFVEFGVMFANYPGHQNYPARYYHKHKLHWKSSNGDMSALTKVGTRESVVHRTSPSGPPFDPVMNASHAMSFTQGATTNSGSNSGLCWDDHSIGNPSLILARPLVVASVIADQDYQYTTDGVNWHSIPDAQYELEKGVRMSGGKLVFFFRKQSAPPHTNRFHFEVEYPIGQKFAVSGNKIPVPAAAFVPKADINAYASKVVKLG